jgi:type IV secretory pathway TrbD component
VEARSAGTVRLGPAGPLRSAPVLPVNARRGPRVQTLGSWPLLLAAVLLALVVGTLVHESFPGRRSVSAAHVRAHRFSHTGLEGLPVAAQAPVSAALGAEIQAYRVSRLRGGFTASSPAQRLSASFTRSGVSVRSGSAKVGLSLLAVGYGSRLAALAQVAPSAHANRVLYRRSGLEEWYANGPLGLEQGFTIARAPSRYTNGPLTLSMALSGDVKASLASGAQSIVISHAGRAVMRYTGLLAADAGGRVLHSWLALEGGLLLLRVDAAGARYPLRIDPLIQQGEKLAGAGEIASGRFGYSVALSADGDTALIGARYAIRNNNEAGGAWVFTRSGSTWTQQGGKLNGTGHAGETLFDHIGEGAFGYSVALSADGNTALIGAPDDNGDVENTGGVGAVWVFTRSGGAWTQQGEKLTGTGGSEKGEFGKSVALSANGETALIGAPEDNGGVADNGAVGAAWVFTRSGSSWTQQGEKLVGDCIASCANEGTGESGEGEFATSVALSEDGETALIGGPGDNGVVGAAWVFTRSGSSWTQQGQKLVGDCASSCANEGAGESGEGKFGTMVTLSANGETALIGAPEDNGGAVDNGAVGAAWVFTRSGSSWTQQGQKLVGDCTVSCANEGTGESGEGKFATSVALAEDGSTALIGAPDDNGGAVDNGAVGAAWVFTRSDGAWSQQGQKLTGGGESGESEFGYSVALAEDGNTAVIGGPEDDTDSGAVWAFTRSDGAWSQQGQKLIGGEEGNSQFGVYVALAADGNTALIGGPGDNNDAGAAWVFTRSGGVWSQQAKLIGRGETREDGFGVSVALSADGNTALIGAPGDDGGLFGKGAAWVFTRSDGSWTQQGEKLVGDCISSCANEGTGEIYNAWFGYNVALSADGNTALIGGFRDNDWRGAAWVFARSGSSWTQQGEKLVGDCTSSCANEGAGESGEGKFATSVALSEDGDTAMIGAWDDDSGRGAVWVFTRSGSTWTQLGEKLVGDCTASCANQGTGETGAGRFGVTVALSADGNTALIGGLDDNGTRGAVWLFTRSGSTWTQQGEKFTGGGEAGEGEFGTNVALSADGGTAMIGAWRDNGGRGAAWVFVDPPTATTGAAAGVGETSATLNGTLGAGGSGTAYFQYGTTAAYGSSTVAQSVGASSSPSPLAGAVAGLAPGTTYHFRLVAENSGGVVYGADQTFTTEAKGATSTTEVITTPPITTPPARLTSPSPPVSAETPPPVVLHVRQSATRWREGNRLARVSRAKTPIGTTFSFSLNEQATVTFSFVQRVGASVTAGKLTFTGHSGANEVVFQGRISSAKKLKPGRYTLLITATNSAGVRSAPESLSFTIVK